MIDGTDVAGGGPLTVSGPVDLDRADLPGQPVRSVGTMTFSTSVSDVSDSTGAALRLALYPTNHPGTEQLTVETRISEQYAPDVPQFGSVSWTAGRRRGNGR
ncbi:hypothetical protein [Paenarthrobacter sp. PH39-S1]|uniref:hypothetical protein n=1 Tax=Paenarthrobacter sp. PH39-S1 TaxID=3046204 RepID=UPI0024BA32D0|nr:hypothetical protein [Paenarthrobacter sp. PH39-S1]MDJ0355245.1 hypothetical protein [Paenarthrobacter sp. PH39-S1]